MQSSGESTAVSERAGGAGRPRLLDEVRRRLRVKHYSIRTEQAYLYWIRRYIRANGMRHPRGMGGAEVERFLSDLARRDRVAPSTQNQALSALLFLYREVLALDLPWMENVVRAKRAPRLPVVLSRGETAALLRMLSGREALMAGLLYGSGLRLMECLRLRVKDVDLRRNELTVREGKGKESADDAARSAACRDAGAAGSDHYQALIQSQYGPAMPAGSPLINRLSMMRSRSEAAPAE